MKAKLYLQLSAPHSKRNCHAVTGSRKTTAVSRTKRAEASNFILKETLLIRKTEEIVSRRVHLNL